MNIDQLNISIESDSGQPINCDLRWNTKSKESPLLIIAHGFKAFKDWGFFPYISTVFADLGYITICFNFSMNGVSNDNDWYDQTELFEMNTISIQMDDLRKVIKYLDDENFIPHTIKQIWNGKIYLLGHSLGAAISILIAAENSDINKIALWAPISKLDRYSPRQKDIWRKKGKMKFKDGRTGIELSMGLDFLEDIENNIEKYNLPSAVNNLQIPMLIAHGKEDITVRPAESAELAEMYEGESLFYNIVENTGHTFGVGHPMNKTTPALEKMIDITNYFLLK
jgi:pimeloyl-ACP methyl ester carboxylesterase